MAIHRNSRALPGLGAIFAAALLLAPGCAYDRVTESTVLQWYDLEEDVELGQETLTSFMAALDEKGIPYDDDERLLGEIRDIVARVGAVSHYPELPWEAHLAELADVNAWCAPGGKIMVYRGLLDPEKGLVKTRHELAAVLAHECAHATARHVTRQRSQRYTLLATAWPAFIAVAVVAPGASQAVGLAFDTSVNLYLPAYSRGQEEEADALGLTYMAKAGYDPNAAVRVWKRAAEKGEGGGGLYSTHPDHAARAAALEAMLPEAEALYREALAGFAAGKAPATGASGGAAAAAEGEAP